MTNAAAAAATRFLVMILILRRLLFPFSLRGLRRTVPAVGVFVGPRAGNLSCSKGHFRNHPIWVDSDIGQTAGVKACCALADVRHEMTAPAYYLEEVADDPVLDALEGLV